MSHEYYNIVIGGEGVRRRSNGINAEKITFFSNFVSVQRTFVDHCTFLIKKRVLGIAQC